MDVRREGRADLGGADGFSRQMGGGGLPPRGRFGTEWKLEDAGDGGVAFGREDRVSSRANRESDCSDKSVARMAADSDGGGIVIVCLVAIQFQPGDRYSY